MDQLHGLVEITSIALSVGGKHAFRVNWGVTFVGMKSLSSTRKEELSFLRESSYEKEFQNMRADSFYVDGACSDDELV